jgi:hypothetical protein
MNALQGRRLKDGTARGRKQCPAIFFPFIHPEKFAEIDRNQMSLVPDTANSPWSVQQSDNRLQRLLSVDTAECSLAKKRRIPNSVHGRRSFAAVVL